MNIEQIQKHRNKSIDQLHKLATEFFNNWIRKRDEAKGCVSCDDRVIQHASHFYSAGHYPILRYDENNVHGSCLRCNYFLSGNLIEYRKRITKRISEDELKQLDFKVSRYKQTGYKWDRWFLIEIIEKYNNSIK